MSGIPTGMAAGRGRAAVGFSVHTGWAAMVTASGPATSPAVLDRRRVEMIPGRGPESPPFVYHAARKLQLEAAERLVRQCAELSGANAKAAAILKSHALVHAAEGDLFREAIRSASRTIGIPVTEVRARDLQPRAAATLGASDGKLGPSLVRIGRDAGKPWARDQQEACLAALIALLEVTAP